MKKKLWTNNKNLGRVLLFVGIISSFVASVHTQTSVFTYQGRLTDGPLLANSTYQMQFSLFDAATGTGQIGSTVTNNSVSVSSGIFTVQLDFSPANPFAAGADRFLEIAVRKASDPPGFTVLTPRQQITSSPYSIKSLGAASADSLSSSCLECVLDNHIYKVSGSKVSGPVNEAIDAVNAVNASNLTTTLPISNGGTGSTTKSFVDLTTNQTVGGNKTFTGTLFGNGSGLTNVSATPPDGSVTTAKLADASVTEAKLAADLVNSPARNLTLLGSVRWDLLKGQLDDNVGNGPQALAFDGTYIWVTNYFSGSITKLLAKDGSSPGTYGAGNHPYGVAFDGTNIWTANQGSSNVSKLRASDGTFLAAYTAGNTPTGIVFDGVNIWVANQGSNNVTKLRASDGTNRGTFAVGTSPFFIAFDGANIWVSNYTSSNVSKLRASDGFNLGTFPVGSLPVGIAFDGANIWVANSGSTTVSKLRKSDGFSLGTFTVGTQPTGVAFDGANIWVTGTNDNNVIKLRASDGAVLDTFPVGSGPQGITFDGTNIWVGNFFGGTVTRLPPAFP